MRALLIELPPLRRQYILLFRVYALKNLRKVVIYKVGCSNAAPFCRSGDASICSILLREDQFVMEIKKTGVAGTMESSDIIVRIEPKETEGIELELESAVMQQYGKQIEKVIRQTLSELGVTKAYVNATDKGALDCTVAARTQAAAYRAAESTDFTWKFGGVK